MEIEDYGIPDVSSTTSSWIDACSGDVLVVDASSEGAAGVVETGSKPASESAISEGSWEIANCPSSGPPSIACSNGSNTCVRGDAPAPRHLPQGSSRLEVLVNVRQVSTSHESDADELCETFAERRFMCRMGRHPGKRDLRKREMQARRHATDDDTQSTQVLLRKRAKRLAKTHLAKKERCLTRYRVEERRFKRRYRDWCCFGESGTKSGVFLQRPYTSGTGFQLGMWGGSLASMAWWTQPNMILEPEAGPKNKPRGESKFKVIYARAAYWRTAALLRECFGHACPDGTLAVHDAKIRSEKAAAAKSLAKILAIKRKLPTRRYLPCHTTPFSVARFVHLAFSRKSRSGRWQTAQIRKFELKRWMRRAWRGASPETEVSTTAAKCRLAESRKVAKQARCQMRSAQRDAKHFGFDSAHCRQVSLTPSKPPKIFTKFLATRRTKDSRCSEDVVSPLSQYRKSLVGNCKTTDSTGGIACARLVVPGLADDVSELIPVWECLDEFQFVKLPDTDGKILIPSPPSAKPHQHQVATKSVFLHRLHKRTHSMLKDIDWSNLRIIGGMMLACLVADEEDFAKNFAETDVDIYIVGLSGLAFKERVASLVEELYRSASAMSIRAVVLRTPCTITLSLCGPHGERLPNVQIVMAPFESTNRLLFTTDIDCTGFGFDGDLLFATPWARQAIAHRRIIARPEKYNIRGEWATETRLMKYAMRGFRVIDLGLRPDIDVPNHSDIKSIAEDASVSLLKKALCESNDELPLEAMVRKFERMVRATGVTGAHLLLLALQNQGLRELLLFDIPLLPAGMGNERRLAMVSNCDLSAPLMKNDGYDHFLPSTQKLPKKHCKLQILYSERTRGDIKGIVMKAAVERDPDSVSEVRCWYTGLMENNAALEHHI